MKLEIEIQIPAVPNFILLVADPIERQVGFQETPKVSIAKFSHKELEEIGRLWTCKLIKRADELRNMK